MPGGVGGVWCGTVPASLYGCLCCEVCGVLFPCRGLQGVVYGVVVGLCGVQVGLCVEWAGVLVSAVLVVVVVVVGAVSSETSCVCIMCMLRAGLVPLLLVWSCVSAVIVVGAVVG